MLSQPGDTLEIEAERAADEVMRSPRSAARPTSRAAATGGPSLDTASLPASVAQTLRGRSEPLGDATRRKMESRLGQDFSRVRIFRGAEAERSAEAVNARAYTVGDNIVFGADEYAPESSAGQRLLAHELAHVAQQNQTSGGASEPLIQRESTGKQTPPPTAVDDGVVWHYINSALKAHDGSVFGAWIELKAMRDEGGDRAMDPNLAAAEHYMFARFLSEDTPLPSFFVADMALGYGFLKDFMRDKLGADPSFSSSPTTQSTDSQKKYGMMGSFEGSWFRGDSWLTKALEAAQDSEVYYDF